MNYDIGFKSEYGKGSEFFVKFNYEIETTQDDILISS